MMKQGKNTRLAAQFSSMADRGFRHGLQAATLCFAGLCFYLLLAGRDGSFLALVASVACLFGTRVAEIVAFKLGLTGLETELRDAIHEAEVTFEQFNELAGSWAKVALQQVYAEGRFGGMPRSDRRILRDRIFNALAGMDVSEQEMEAMKQIEYRYTHFDYAQYVLDVAVGLDTWEWNKDSHDFNNAHQGMGNEPSPDQIEELLRRHLRLNPEVEARLADYRHYEEFREHRRPAIWENA